MCKFRLAVSYRNRKCKLKRPPMPEWLSPGRNQKFKNSRSFKYWTKIYWATPPWLNEKQINEMKLIYESTSSNEHVDHIVPLLNPLVCGLHVPWNLQKLPDRLNQAKSNHIWPDMPEPNIDLFGDNWNGDANAL